MPDNKYIIPEEKEIIRGENNFSEKCVIHPVEEDDRRYVISFKDYKKKKCDIDDINQTANLQKALRWFRDVGLASTEDEIPKSDRIKNSGNYSFLYNGLSDEDVEIREYKFGGTNRIFYYVDEATKTVNCILIKHSHLEY